MTPTTDAQRTAEYYRALLDCKIDQADALAFTVAWIQADAMRQFTLEPETRPKPRITR